MNATTRLQSTAQNLRTIAEGASGPEMDVIVNSAALLVVLDAVDSLAPTATQVIPPGEVLRFQNTAQAPQGGAAC